MGFHGFTICSMKINFLKFDKNPGKEMGVMNETERSSFLMDGRCGPDQSVVFCEVYSL